MPHSGTTSYLVRVGDLPALRAQVEGLAKQDQVNAERLLGQLVTLEAANLDRAPHEHVDFTPPPGCEELAQRAVAELYSGRFRRRPR